MQSGQRSELVNTKTRESTRLIFCYSFGTRLIDLGESCEQKGSYVDSSKLRFDFSHKKALSVSELSEVERLVTVR